MTFLSGHTKHFSQEQIGSILPRLGLWDGCKDTAQKALPFLYWLRIARSGPVHGMSLLPSLRCPGWQMRWRETSTNLFILLFLSLQFMGLNSEIQYQFNIVGHHKSPPITVSHSLILSLLKEFSLVWYVKQSLKLQAMSQRGSFQLRAGDVDRMNRVEGVMLPRESTGSLSQPPGLHKMSG